MTDANLKEIKEKVEDFVINIEGIQMDILSSLLVSINNITKEISCLKYMIDNKTDKNNPSCRCRD